jgi:two-component system response regulator HydG
VVPIEIPPLRQRREDLAELITRFFSEARSKHPAAVVERLSAPALEALLKHDWPGNVRELSHVIERIVLLGRSAEVTVEELPATVLVRTKGTGLSFGTEVIPVRELQRKYALWALERCGGHKGRTAEELGIDGKTLTKWLSEG